MEGTARGGAALFQRAQGVLPFALQTERDAMTVHLPPRANAFPKAEAAPVPGNAWGSQWKHLPRAPRVLVRHAIDGLRAMRLG